MASNDDISDLGAVDSIDDLGAIDIPEEEYTDISKTESAVRGAAQSASLGFIDEITGALEAGKDVTFDEQKKLSDLLDLYRQHRDESRSAYAQAEATNPLSYLGGGIAGSFVPGLGAVGALAKGASVGTRLLSAASTGAKLGAAVGLGQSEADITGGELGRAIEDTAAGGAAGAIGGAAMIPIEGAIGSVMSHRFVSEPLEALKRGFKGQNLIGREATDLIEKQQSEATKDMITDLAAGSKGAAEQKRALLNEMEETGVSFDIGPKLREAGDATRDLPTFTRAERMDVRNLDDLLDNAYKKYGESLPPKDELVKLAMQEGIAPLDLETGKVNKEFKQFVENYGKVNRTINPAEVSPMQLEELRKSASTLTDLGEQGLATPGAKKAANNLSSGLKETIRSHPVYGTPLKLSDEALSTYYTAQEILFGDKLTRNLTSDEMAKLQNAIKTKMLDLEQKGKGGTRARELFGSAFDELEKVDPAFVRKHRERLTDLATAYDLNKSIEAVGLGSGTTGRGAILAKSNKVGQAAGEIFRGTVEPVKNIAQKTASLIKGSTPDSIKDLVNKLSTMGADAVPKGLREKLAVAAERKDNVSRNAMLYTLLQQPAYREFLLSFMPD